VRTTEPIAAYLAEIERQLPGPGSLRQDVLDELRDGLEEAAGGAGGGMPGDGLPQAPSVIRARSTIDGFGDPVQVGAALAAEMRLRLVRRRAVQMVAVVATIHVGWLVFRNVVGFSTALVPPAPTDTVFVAAVHTIRTVGWVAVIATAGLVFATSTRWRGGATLGLAVVGAAVGAVAVALVSGGTALATIEEPSVPMLGVGVASLLALLAVALTGIRILGHIVAIRRAQ
jgi:hypothetical protein